VSLPSGPCGAVANCLEHKAANIRSLACSALACLAHFDEAGPAATHLLTEARAKAWCLLTHAEAYLSHRGQGDSLGPPYTRRSYLSLPFHQLTLVSVPAQT
jgi:hypothetical protein